MRFRPLLWLVAAAALIGAGSPALAGSRIKDIVQFEGVRENQLVGYGLVVGLAGTGDSLRNAPMTKQSLEAMLERLGVNTRDATMDTKNVAAVMVTASLPAFAASGSHIDVTVSAMGDAKSLLGGTLLVTPLLAADGEAYALAQGTVETGSVSAGGASGSSVTRGVPTAGRIADGASVEREVGFSLNSMPSLRLTLRNPDFTTAKRIADVIDAAHAGAAVAENPTIVTIRPPPGETMESFVTEVEELQVDPDAPAKVVIDEVAGVIVMGDSVRLSTVAIAQGNLTISVQETPQVSQPLPFSQGATQVTPQSQVKVDEEKGKKLIMLNQGGLAGLAGGGPERPGRHAARHDLHPAGDQGRRRPASRYRGDVMTDLSPAVVPLASLKPVALAAPTPAQTANRAAIHRTAQQFESQFISQMLGNMFEGVDTPAPFGGGEGEAAFKSFLMDAMAKQMTKAGGLGITASVQREMLKMQGLK